MTILRGICRIIDGVNGTVGRWVAWLALVMVLLQFALVMLRYVFGVGSLAAQEAVVYMHGLLFMLAAANTLLLDGHVRVDIFYAEASDRRKAWVNLFGAVVFAIPMCLLIIYIAHPYIVRSWAVLEGSRETSGLPGVFLFKSVIHVFAVMLLLQGLSLAVKSLDILLGNAPAGQGED